MQLTLKGSHREKANFEFEYAAVESLFEWRLIEIIENDWKLISS